MTEENSQVALIYAAHERITAVGEEGPALEEVDVALVMQGLGTAWLKGEIQN